MSMREEQNHSNQHSDPIRSHIPTLLVVKDLSASNDRTNAIAPAFSPGGACAAIIPDAESSLRPRPSNRTFSNKREIVPLIIPFRNRNHHLQVFLAHMESHFERHNLEPMFIVVDQVRISCVCVSLCGSLLRISCSARRKESDQRVLNF